MMLYTVYLKISRQRAAEWRAWMQQTHIPEVLETGCFLRCLLARDASQDTSERLAWRILYVAASEEALHTYQDEHAPSLQKDHTQRYAGDFEAYRDILPVLQEFSSF